MRPSGHVARDARHAVALLSGRTVVHRQPSHYDDLLVAGGDVGFLCGWCGRTVPMREMLSHGGLSGWRSSWMETSVHDAALVGCWEVYLP